MGMGTSPAGTQGKLSALADSQDRKAGGAIELFHFALLEVAVAQLRSDEYALKGGGNLRMFLGSRRRSRDLDLDFLGEDFGRFGDRVNALFKSRELASGLAARNIRTLDPHLTKDSETTKRWKLSLSAPGMEDAPTKVEFSNRRTEATALLESCDAALAAALGVSPVVVNHYPPKHAIEQKVGALAQRSETQPRDVFDLQHLFAAFPTALDEAQVPTDVLRGALDRVWQITYLEYQSLVVDYLDEEIALDMGSEDAWMTVQLSVAGQLDEWLKKGEVE